MEKLFTLALVAYFGSFASPARALPVHYELDMKGFGASGSFDGKPFKAGLLVLTFDGDTYLVEPFTFKASPKNVNGFLNLVGTATVAVIDSNYQLLGQGTFLPTAGIFMSVDNTNGGVGFGSFGVPPGNPNFPGHPVYPAAMIVPLGFTYNLQTDLQLDYYAIGCFNFPATPCKTGLALPTTGGDLVLDQVIGTPALFTATVQPATVFASFAVNAQVATGKYDVNGSFTLGAGSDGLHPVAEVVTLHLDSYRVSVPPGSFKRVTGGGYSFQGKINDVTLDFVLQPKSSTAFTFNFSGTGSGVPALTNPLKVSLTIGDDSGSKTVTATIN